MQPVVITEAGNVSLDCTVRENWGLHWSQHWLSQCPAVSNAVWFTLSGRLRIWNQVQFYAGSFIVCTLTMYMHYFYSASA